MDKTIRILILISAFILFCSPVKAEKIAGPSANITYNSDILPNVSSMALKKLAVKRVLEKYNSPLIDSTDSFIESCTEYNLDCYLLPSVAGVESTFGKFLYQNSYNPFGWGGGKIMFSKWSDSIDAVGKGLRLKYIDKGATSIELIGRIYCGNDAWAKKVRFFMNEFSVEEQKIQLFLNNNTVQL